MIYDAKRARERAWGAAHYCPLPEIDKHDPGHHGTVWQCPECRQYWVVGSREDWTTVYVWRPVTWFDFKARRRIHEATG